MWAPWSYAATSNAERVRVEVFSKISAISLPARPLVSVPAYFAVLSASESRSRNRSSPGSKSISLRKLRFRRLYDIVAPWSRIGSERGVALDRAGHAVPTTAPASELETLDGDDLDPGLAERGVRTDVAFVRDDDPRFEGDDVVAVVPLFALRPRRSRHRFRSRASRRCRAPGPCTRRAFPLVLPRPAGPGCRRRGWPRSGPRPRRSGKSVTRSRSHMVMTVSRCM